MKLIILFLKKITDFPKNDSSTKHFLKMILNCFKNLVVSKKPNQNGNKLQKKVQNIKDRMNMMRMLNFNQKDFDKHRQISRRKNAP